MATSYKGFAPDPDGGYKFEPLRKFRWEMTIGGGADEQGALRLVLLTCSRPTMEFESTDVHHFNDRFYLAGKPSFSEIEFSMYDALVSNDKAGSGKYAAKILEEWRDKVYDPRTNIMLPAEGTTGYKKNCVIKQFDGAGNDLVAWDVIGCFPRVVNFNDLDYASSDACMVNCTMRIDKAFIRE